MHESNFVLLVKYVPFCRTTEVYKNSEDINELQALFYKQRFFSTQPQCCLTFP